MIEVHEDGGDALAAAGAEGAASVSVRVDAIVMFHVPLRRCVPCHLRHRTPPRDRMGEYTGYGVGMEYRVHWGMDTGYTGYGVSMAMGGASA